MILSTVLPAFVCVLLAASGQGGERITAQSIANMVTVGDWAGVEDAARRIHTFKHPIDVEDEFDVLTEVFMSTAYWGGAAVEDGLKGLAICVKHGADPNEGNGKPLRRLATWDRSGRYVEALLNLGADPNLGLEVRTPDGELIEAYAPLGIAVAAKNPDNVSALLKRKANPNAPYGRELVPPLTIAARSGQTDMMEWLLRAGAKVDSRDARMKQTALHAAAGANQLDAIELLLRAKADPKLLDVNGLTPLQFAQQERALAAVRVLSASVGKKRTVVPARRANPNGSCPAQIADWPHKPNAPRTEP